MRRRTFLSGLGASLLAPWGLRRAAAAGPNRAQRLVVFFSPNGSVLEHWRPTGGTRDFTFGAGTILEPLADVREHLVVVDGLDFYGASNHEGGMGAMLTGGGGAGTASGGASVDQFVARELAAPTRFESLVLGVQTSAWGGSTQTRMTYTGSGQMVAPDDDPQSVARRLFPEANPDGGVDPRIARRQSMLDVLRGEVDDLSRRLGTVEQHKLEAHLESLRALERGLETTPGTPAPACNPPSAFMGGSQSNDAFPAVGRAQMDLLVAALACDHTRVASLQWSHTVSPTVFSWLGIGEGHHALSHMHDSNPAGVMSFVLAERWFAEQFAYLVGRLRDLPEPGGAGSMLDNTLVVWAKEMGDSRAHVCESVPFVLAGGAGGALETGRYLRYPGQSHTKLLVSICHAMGLDNPTFGDPAAGTGTLEGLLS